MEASLKIIGGKWKGVILFHLLDGPMRFNELGRAVQGVTSRLLVKQLRELEEDGLGDRTVYPVVPPKVEYALTEEAMTLAPLLRALDVWGGQWLDRRGIVPRNRQNDDASSAASDLRRSRQAVTPSLADRPQGQR